METRHLAIHESLLLLGLDEITGKRTSSYLNVAVASGAVAELVRRDRLTSKVEGKKVFLEVVDLTPTGQPLLDEILTKVEASKRRRQVNDWIYRSAQISHIHIRSADRLLMSGVLRLEEKQMLKIFTLKRLPEVQPHVEAEVRTLIDQALAGGQCDRTTATIIGIAAATKLVKPTGDRSFKRDWKTYVDRLTSGDVLVSETKKAVATANAAAVG